MVTIASRVYDTDSQGVRRLLYRPGDVIDNKEAARVATLVEETPDRPGWMNYMARRDAPAADETPSKPLGDMKLAELRAVCEEEQIDPGAATLRGDFIKVICAARGQRQSKPVNER